jgi:hypothetical protein
VEQGQKISFKNITRRGQGGQALVEYILLLVIMVSLVLGMKKGFSNLSKSMDSYVGDYVKCLMEYGELPSLGVADPDLNRHSVTGGLGKTCDSKFEPFTFSGGFAATSTGGGGGGPGGSGGGSGGTSSGSSSGSNSNNKNSSSNASNNSNNSNGSDSGSNSDDGNGGGKNSRGNKSSSYANRQVRRSSDSFATSDNGADASSAGTAKIRILEDNQDDAKKNRDRNSRKAYYRPNQYIYTTDKYKAITGGELAQIEKTLPRKAKAPVTRTIASPIDDSGMGFGPSRRNFTPPEREQAQIKQSEESGFSFGYLMRWLLIAGIIVAIVVFFGGQIMNYSNSQD